MSRLAPPIPRRILISEKTDWRKTIEQGFETEHHRITFGPFTPANLRQHDLVVPTTIEDLERLDAFRDLLVDNAIPIPSLESLRLCNDKKRLQQALAGNGFSDLLPGAGERLTFPYIVKKRIDQWGRSCHIIRNADDERAHSELLRDPAYFTQPYICGSDEFATHVLFRSGRIVEALNVRYRFRNRMPIKGQHRPMVVHPCRFPFRELFSEILRRIGFEGLCCFNYKLQGGRPRIMEINPRFGGSLAPFFFAFIRHLE